ncbi:MAG: hypothetical protein WCW35_03535 [Bacteroidota bacterium]|jgi:hypothetical protein
MKQAISFVIVFLSCISAAHAQDYYADYLSIGGGYYSAADGSHSSAFDAGYLNTSQGIIIGADLQVKSITATVFGVNNVGISSATFSMYYGYYYPGPIVSPYIAGGLIFGFNGLESSDVTNARPELVIKNSLSQSYGIFGMIGMQHELSGTFALFGDVRYGADYIYTYIENVSDEFVNLGGLYGRVGIRITINSSEDL